MFDLFLKYIAFYPYFGVSETRLLQEWTRMFFGVFSESGFINDPMYPEYFDNGIEIRKNEGCTLDTNLEMSSARDSLVENEYQETERFSQIEANASHMASHTRAVS